MPTNPTIRPLRIAAALGVATIGLVLIPAVSANAASTVTGGPIPLGTAAPFGVLGASTVTNTGPTTVLGDVGLSPGTSVTGFTGAPDGSYTGTLHATDEVAAGANADLTKAYNVAAGLTPTATGFSELTGDSLVPGVYSGVKLSVTGTLTLAGTAESVWVFQADETLTTASASAIVMTGGASVCNVFWKVGSSATLGSSSFFAGTILADQSISVTTGATIAGRLLARVGAVTLQDNDIVAPQDCGPDGTVISSPTVDSTTPPDGTVGTPYEFGIPADGSPTPTITIGEGVLPPGLVLGDDGTISGTPTTPGDYPFEVIISNGEEPDVTVDYIISIVPVAVVPGPGPNAPAPGPGDGSDNPGDGLAYSGTAAGFAAGVPLAIGFLVVGMLSLVLRARERRVLERL